MHNKIEQYSIGELLDGRYFYIPAYQRGYRWTEKQVGDMLRDFLCFANNDKKADFDFYCLQPVIARPITEESRILKICGETNFKSAKDNGVWEIIDGQQRLTTLFLLIKYLLIKKKWNADDLRENANGKELYHLIYATRKGSSDFLENKLDKAFIDVDDSVVNTVADNIDFYHMGRAFRYIDKWLKTEGTKINERYKLDSGLESLTQTLFNLLKAGKQVKTGSVQVLWYQLEEKNFSADNKEKTTQSSIKEFQKINTGKIKLTNAELIKGLFLLEKNFKEGNAIRFSELALEWESIENALHGDNFWYFLQKKGFDMPNRIDLLFTIIYKMKHLEGVKEEDWGNKLTSIEHDLQDVSKDYIFRFYYDRFEGLFGEELQAEIDTAWKEVKNLFRTLDDWFSTPKLYNYIGLLSQFGEDLTRIILHFNAMGPDSTRKDFIGYLHGRIEDHLSGIAVDEVFDKTRNISKKKITNQYSDHFNVYKLLLTLNVHLLNQQNSEHDSESEIYKFPFDVLNEQNWNLEHVDSFHTNDLKKEKDKIEWIMTALQDFSSLSDQDRELVTDYLTNKDYDNAIKELIRKAGEEENDESIKNGVGNLVLLDENTNKSYGNSLFCTKRKIIIQNLQKGRFIPVGTQQVFFKLFDGSGVKRSQWTLEDISLYEDFIYTTLKEYID